MRDIESLDDLRLLVGAFYEEAKKDQVLGPIFNQFVTEWEPHIEKVASFWEATLFSAGPYRANPIIIHQKVDEILSHSLEQLHFDKWVEIWHETTDTMFAGDMANMAKQRASNIANIMFIKLYQARTK